jgi:hypothetical protein
MWRLIKVILFTVLLAALALVIYSYAGPIFFPEDFKAPAEQIILPVELDT